jgi:hypothetical protein
MTLSEFLQEEPVRAFNVQTAYLGGLHLRHHLEGLSLDSDHFDSSLLDRAKAALNDQEAIGFTEAFDESLAVLRNTFGWPVWRTYYRSINRGTADKSVSRGERRVVETANELDLELYSWALDRFPLPTLNPGFAKMNRIYGRLDRAVRKLASR